MNGGNFPILSFKNFCTISFLLRFLSPFFFYINLKYILKLITAFRYISPFISNSASIDLIEPTFVRFRPNGQHVYVSVFYFETALPTRAKSSNCTGLKCTGALNV